MTHELVPETPEQTEWIDGLERELDKYAFNRMKVAIGHAEQLKACTLHPDIMTAEVMIKIANQWLQVETPHFYPKYEYKIKGSGDNYSVYQNIDVEKRHDKGTEETNNDLQDPDPTGI